jgi:hypothetical protein
MLLSEVVAWTLHDGCRGQIVIRCVWRGLGLNEIYEINQPPSRWDWAFRSCRGGNSGYGFASLVHWKSVSVFQSVSIKTAIFLAVAIAALRKPLRPANRIAQDFRAKNLLTFRIKVDADSTSSDRMALSPRFEMRPDQSISPDWYRWAKSNLN